MPSIGIEAAAISGRSCRALRLGAFAWLIGLGLDRLTGGQCVGSPTREPKATGKISHTGDVLPFRNNAASPFKKL